MKAREKELGILDSLGNFATVFLFSTGPITLNPLCLILPQLQNKDNDFLPQSYCEFKFIYKKH